MYGSSLAKITSGYSRRCATKGNSRQRSLLTTSLSGSRLANLTAGEIHKAFITYQSSFKEITGRARTRFEQEDAHGMQSDALERLQVYRQSIDAIVDGITGVMESRVHDETVWASVKAVYSGLIAERHDAELAETFFNSVTRRIFTTVGVDSMIEFVSTDFDITPSGGTDEVHIILAGGLKIPELISTMLAFFRFGSPSMTERLLEVESRVHEHISSMGLPREITRVEIARNLFFRGNAAYVVARMTVGGQHVPLVLALLHTGAGITLDAVLLDEDDVSILFSFAYSYFHVAVGRPSVLVAFLRSLMPKKRVAELYISLGYNKHGKTELYRDILDHLSVTRDQFDLAPGQRGLVMIVFTMPGYDLVFKVIRDRFMEPKNTTRQAVMAKYHLVFNHDRAGRLVDAQEFEHMQLDRQRFSDELLQELCTEASETVTTTERLVIIRHVYVERRMTPLDLYLSRAGQEAASAAVMDYGQAIKDLAATNIFPGDMLLKNLGVTRHGRVVFYDYDELCWLGECNFRPLPQPSTLEEEYSIDPWFYVGEADIFPEEFRKFLVLRKDLRETFVQVHADLFEVEFWKGLQHRHTNGEIIHIVPYAAANRLGRH